MITEVLNAVADALSEAFPDHEIYTDNPLQGMETPAFLIDVITPDRPQLIGNLYEWDIPVIVQYFPKGNDTNDSDYRETAEKLIECLELLNVDVAEGNVTFRRSSVDFARSDGFSTYTAQYKHKFWFKPDDANLMQTLEKDVDIN